MVVRKLLDMVFSQHDLAWLDDLLPEKEKKRSDDDKKKGKEKEKDKKKPKADDSEEEVRFLSFAAPCRTDASLHQGLLCVCNILMCGGLFPQEKYHGYPNHSPSSESDVDRRYCVLKLHIPYKDLVHPDVEQSQWGAHCQPATNTHMYM